MLKNSKKPMIKLPSETELVLYLIKEELKTNKHFTGLRMAGLDDCYYQSYLGSLVLAYSGFEDDSDEIIDFYNKLLDQYTEKLEPDNEVIMKCAFDLYTDLITEKKKRQGRF